MVLVVVVCVSLAKELKASWKSIVAAASAPPPEGQSHIKPSRSHNQSLSRWLIAYHQAILPLLDTVASVCAYAGSEEVDLLSPAAIGQRAKTVLTWKAVYEVRRISMP
jgi:hypothetical protein